MYQQSLAAGQAQAQTQGTGAHHASSTSPVGHAPSQLIGSNNFQFANMAIQPQVNRSQVNIMNQ